MSELFEDLSIPEDIDEIEVLLSGTVDANANISGQMIQIQSGTTIQLPSTQIVQISGQIVQLQSGTTVTIAGGVNVSGETVRLESGTTVQLPVTQIVKVSGETVSVASGVFIAGNFTILSGFIDIQSGSVLADISGHTVKLESGTTVTIAGGVNVSGQTVQLQSGTTVQLPSTQIVRVSGETVVTAKEGASVTLFSGYPTTNTIVVSGIAFLKHEKATILIKNIGEAGSGVNYSVQGYALSGVLSYVMASGTLYSGDVTVETITDPYEWIAVGIDSTQDNFSGQVTVVAVRR